MIIAILALSLIAGIALHFWLVFQHALRPDSFPGNLPYHPVAIGFGLPLSLAVISVAIVLEPYFLEVRAMARSWKRKVFGQSVSEKSFMDSIERMISRFNYRDYLDYMWDFCRQLKRHEESGLFLPFMELGKPSIGNEHDFVVLSSPLHVFGIEVMAFQPNPNIAIGPTLLTETDFDRAVEVIAGHLPKGVEITRNDGAGGRSFVAGRLVKELDGSSGHDYMCGVCVFQARDPNTTIFKRSVVSISCIFGSDGSFT